MVLKIIGVFFAVLFFGIVLNMPSHLNLYSAIIGTLALFIYLVLSEYIINSALVTLITSIFVAIISNIFAKKFKSPVTLFLTCGILPMVPGILIYRTVYFMLINQVEQSQYYFNQTLQNAGAIALGIFLVESFFRIKRKNIK